MPVAGTGAQRVEAASPHRWAGLAPERRAIRRISGRRALGLTLPGLLVTDALLVTGSFLAALRILAPRSGPALASPAAVGPQLFALYAVLFAGFLLLGGMFGLYERRSLFAPRRAVAAAARALFWSGGVAVAFAFLLALDPPGDLRLLLLTHAILLSLGVMVLRPLACRWLLRLAEIGPLSPRRLLVLGCDDASRRVAATLEQQGGGSIAVAGLAGVQVAEPTAPWKWARFPLGGWDEAVELADALAVDEVVLATPELARADAVLLSYALARAGYGARVVPHVAGLHVDGVPVDRERGVPTSRLGTHPDRRFELRLKRLFDLAAALLGGAVVLPLFLLIAAAIRLTSRGPVLYAHTRVGRDGRAFRMFKFRSMEVANDDRRHREYVAALVRDGSAAGRDANGRPVYKILDDPRVTMVGRFIRATSLDELPQLINVLRGEMSLVGPRPCLPFEYELYEDWQRLRLEVTPGITGLWQVSGRSLLSFEEMVLLDLYYVANWSFGLDLRVLWRTIPEVLSWRGVR